MREGSKVLKDVLREGSKVLKDVPRTIEVP